MLRALGVLEQVRRAGVDVPRQRMWAGSGKLLGDVPRGRLGGDDLYRHERMPSAVLAATTALHRPTLTHTLDAVTVRHNDRIVLLGDADHPVGAGQGASMALEDALVLARSLGTETSVPAALSAYDAARSDRLARMAKAAAGNGDSKTAGPLGRWARDLMMPAGIRLFYEKAMAWLYTYDCGELPAAPAGMLRD